MAFGLYYPTKASPDVQWVPSQQPLPGSIPGDASDVTQQRLATGRKLNWGGPAPRLRYWRLVFDLLVQDDVDDRRTFWTTVGGAAFELETEFDGTLYTAMFTGVSLAFRPVSRGAGFYGWEEEFEEQPS